MSRIAGAGESTSIKGTLRSLGCSGYSGSMHNHIKRQLVRFGIDTSHFLGCSVGLGSPARNRKTVSQILKSGYVSRAPTLQLRRALLDSGVLHCCAACGSLPEWQGGPLLLHIDHIDGDWSNNLQSNLRFLCPNCHSQTSTFGNTGSVRVKILPCVCCGKAVQVTSRMTKSGTVHPRCRGCVGAANLKKPGRKPVQPERGLWPSDADLRTLVWLKPVTKVGVSIGVSGGAVKKRCNRLGIPTPPRGYWQRQTSYGGG